MPFKALIKNLVLAALVLAVIFQGLILALPGLAQRWVKHYLPLAGADLEFKIEKIGLGQALVSQVSLGKDLSIGLVHVHYGFKGFKTFGLEKLVVYGLNLHARLDADNQLFFNGAPFPQKKTTPGLETSPGPGSDSDSASDSSQGSDPGPGASPLDLASLLPFLPGHIRLKQTSVSLSQEGASPLSFDLSSPVDLDLINAGDSQWKLTLSSLHPTGPGIPSIKIENFMASLGLGPESLTATGEFDLATSLVPPLGLVFALNLTSPDLFDLTLKNKALDTIQFSAMELGLGPLGFEKPSLVLGLKGTMANASGQMEFDCKNMKAGIGGQAVSIKNILVRSRVQADFSDKGNGLNFDIDSDLSSIKLASKAGQADFKSLHVTGRGQVSKLFEPLIQVEARLENGNLSFPEFKVTGSHISAQIPFVFPFKKGRKPGTFSIPDLVYDQTFKASLQGQVFQNRPLEIAMTSQGILPDFPGLRLDLEAKTGMDPDLYAEIDFKVDPFSLTGVHAGKIMTNMYLSPESSIEISSKGSVSYGGHDLKTQARIMLKEGNLFFPDMDLTLTGIAGNIDLQDLFVLESLPGQELTIDRIQADQFLIDNARLRFSIEDGESINMENLRFNWCNGIVSTESFRLPARNNMLSLILYCDRLELSDLLKQMGAFHAEGEGTLNGRIPVMYSNGNISFDRGFLFSTPGKGGRVVIENSDKIIAGIPMDTPEFSQLDLAREALKDFEYKWAKLELNTLEDTLYVKMEMDGKPARVLPFEYRKEVNSFVRVNASSPGSRFQGIKMDVNLKLPFNQVLKYGSRIKKMFQ